MIETGVVLAVGSLILLYLAWIVSKKFRTSFPQALMWIVTIAVAAHVLYVNLEPGGFSFAILDGVLTGKANNSADLQKYNSIDEEFRRYSGQGNVALTLAGFDATKPRDRDFLTFEYFRSVYAVYPRRVFCGEASNTVNTAQDLAALRFNPDQNWLDAHAVTTIVSFRVDEHDQLDQKLTTRGDSTTDKLHHR